MSKDETAKGGTQLSVLVPHFSFTYIRFPPPALRWCRSDSPTNLYPIIRLVVLLFACVLFLTFPLFSFLVRRVSSSVASRLEVESCARSQLTCSQTRLRMTMESKTEGKSSKRRTWRWKDMKMKSTEIKWKWKLWNACSAAGLNQQTNMQINMILNISWRENSQESGNDHKAKHGKPKK